MQKPPGLLARIALAALLAFLLGLSPVAGAPGPLCYVRPGGPGPDGDSWATAYANLQDALADHSCTEIWVAAGTYLPDESDPGNQTLSFGLKTSVEIYGGFAGTENQRNQRNWLANETILSGNIGLPGDDTDNSYHVVVGDAGASSVLDGFTIRDGYAHGLGGHNVGGGILISNGSPTLRNLTITDNQGALGGGMYVGQGNPVLSRVIFTDNIADFAGGMYAQEGNSTLTDITFDRNEATSGLGGWGGGLAIGTSTTSATLNNVTFSRNTAQGPGGGMYNGGNVLLTNVTFAFNESQSGGGAFHNLQSSATINHATFRDNDGLGDSLMLEDGAVTVTNSLFGITTAAHFNLTGGSLDIIDSLSPVACPVIAGLACTNVIVASTLLGALQNNGGFTQTMWIEPGSPAMDAGGVNAACAATDQRGVPRPQFAACDLGAYELIDHAAGPRCYVDADITWAGNGSSWTTAYRDLQHALINTDCKEVWVAEGTYKPDYGTGDRDISFALPFTGVEVYGGFTGIESLLSERDWQANPTILSGEIGALGSADNSYHVVLVVGPHLPIVLDGFTIRDGYADGPSFHNTGGGMYIDDGSPTLNNLVIRNNTASVFGGGIYSLISSNPTLNDVTFTNNTANFGGGMANISNAPLLTNVTFDSNSASSNGGGMFNVASSPTLNNVTFHNNSATIGGGMENAGGVHTLNNVTFSDNSASLEGGAIRNATDSNMQIYNSIFWGNAPDEIASNSSGVTLTINDSLVQGGCPSGPGANTCNGALLTVNPLLGLLQDNGGLTHTFALGAASPAIDAGNSSTCLTTDQRGVARPQHTGCDMGAYEYDGALPPTLADPGTSFASKDIAPSGTTTLQFGRIWVSVPAGAIPPGQTDCRLTIQIRGDSGEYGFSLDDTVWDVKISCAGSELNIFFDALTICIRPVDSLLGDKNVYHRHGGQGFQAISGGQGPAGFVCGQTRTLSLFTLGQLSLPATGFAPGVVTELGAPSLAYAASDLTLSIPKLGLNLEILGVPQGPNGWDVSWLANNQAGYLYGTAFPTWKGNSVLTAHVWNADNTPGPFHALKDLQHGDRFTISVYGQTYTYEVRSNRLVSESNLNVLTANSDYSQITLLTCETYSERSGGYLYRRAVQAVLVAVH
ncbi:MAG: sortase [Anaerolineales bacterium]|nr:sortase [Anaerolineales bacterium]